MDAPLRTLLSPLILVLAVATLASADPAGDQYAVAAAHYGAGRWQLAIDEFRAYLRDFADHAAERDARFFYAEALVQAGQYAKAAHEFRRFRRDSPQAAFAPKALFRSGEASYLAGDVEAARADLESFTRDFGKNELCAYALPYLADLALRRGDAAAAEQLFDETLRAYPQGPMQDDCRFGLARALEAQRQGERARRLYQALASKKSIELADDAYYRWGVTLVTDQDLEAAAEHLARFGAEFPDSSLAAWARVRQVEALVRLGRHDDALPLATALEDDPSVGAEASYWAARVYRSQEQSDRAVAALSRARGRTADCEWLATIGVELAECFLSQQDNERALIEFDQVVSQWPGAAAADDAALGKLETLLALARHDDLDRASDDFRAAFPTSELSDSVTRVRARSLVARRDLAAAAALVEPLAASGDAAAIAILAAAEAGAGRHEAALEALARIDLESKDLTASLRREVVRTRATSLAALGRHAQAVAALEEFLLLDAPHDHVCAALAQLAISLAAIDRFDQSRAALDKLRAADPPQDTEMRAIDALADLTTRAGQLEWAAQLAESLSADGSPEAFAVRGMWQRARLARAADRHEESEQHFAQLLDRFSNFAERDAVLYESAWNLREAGRLDQSLGRFSEIADRYESSRYWSDSVFRLAEAAFGANDRDAARRYLDRFRASPAVDDVCPHALYLEAQLAMADEAWSDAERALLRLTCRWYDSPLAEAAEYWAAEAAYRLEHYDTALARFERLCDARASDAQPWRGLAALRRAQSLAYLKRWDEAEAVAARIEREFPGFERQYEVDYVLGRCYAAQALLERAREAYRAVIRSPAGAKTETAAMAQWMIGETYFHQKQYATAVREYLRVEILYAYPSWQAAALFEAAQCYEKLAQWKQATEMYVRILKVYPDSPFAARAADRLKLAQARIADSPRK